MTNESRPRMMPVHSPILQVRQNLRDAEKRAEELDATLDKVQSSWLDAKLRIDELTTVLHQLIAQINTSTTVIDKRFSQDGIVHMDYVTALTDLLNGRNEAQKVLDNAADGANLRDLLNKSMIENVELLRQVVSMQEALYEAQGALLGANKRIDELTQELADAQASHHSAMFLLDEAQRDCNGWHDAYVALLKWSQTAYKRLGGLMAIGVSMTPDVVTARLLSDAPANVAADVDPFSATVDENYSIYTDPIFVSVAKELACDVGDVVDYALDSVGAPTDGDK